MDVHDCVANFHKPQNLNSVFPHNFAIPPHRHYNLKLYLIRTKDKQDEYRNVMNLN